jgi:hypothetical protein
MISCEYFENDIEPNYSWQNIGVGELLVNSHKNCRVHKHKQRIQFSNDRVILLLFDKVFLKTILKILIEFAESP